MFKYDNLVLILSVLTYSCHQIDLGSIHEYCCHVGDCSFSILKMGIHFVDWIMFCAFHFNSLLILYFVSHGITNPSLTLGQVPWSLNLFNLLEFLIMVWASDY
uniref:Uncharacterized protein n=1 Tax=Arundo donax TaxID=35708 RepID=A0A0A8XSP4_ARUDO